MVRNRKKSRKPRAGGPKLKARLSPEELEAQGKAQLEARQYRGAIYIFKDLLQQEHRLQWVDALAEAYAGRARELADKGMFKEAITIWRNRADFCDKPLAEPAYLDLLLQVGQIGQAVSLIREQQALLEQQGHLPDLRVLCAAQALAGKEEILAAFPDEDLLVRDYPAAREALEAYSRGEEAAMDRQLKAISYRSPFRDFRQILKALTLPDRDATGIERLLDRIEPGSPFSALCSAIRASRLPGTEFFQCYKSMGQEERNFASALKGWQTQQIRVAQDLIQLGECPRTEKLLRFLLRHREILGEEYVREAGMRMLISHPGGNTDFVKAFGPLSRFNQGRISTLDMEEEEAPPREVFNGWIDVFRELDNPASRQDPTIALTGALVLRRAAAKWLESNSATEATLAALEHSLDCDPDDPPTYLLLIRLYREQRKLKEARRVLDQALNRYPNEPEILTAAVETAIASDAYKKAARFAHRTLELDPINTRVRDILLDSYLAHARKQIRQGKFPLARKELEEATNWACTEVARGRIDNLSGILALDLHDAREAQVRFASGFERTGSGLVGRLHLLLEAVRMDRDLRLLMKQARLPKPPRRADKGQVWALIHALNEQRNVDRDHLIRVMDFLEDSLMKAVKLDYSLPEMELACEVWLRLEQQDLRSRYAQAALKRWRGTPIFVFHRISADLKRHARPTARDFRQLEDAYQRARQEGDERSAHRIGELLYGGMPFGGFGGDPFDPFEGDAAPEARGKELNAEELVDAILDAKAPPEIEEMKRELGPEGMRLLIETIMLGGNLDNDRLAELLAEMSLPKPRGRPRGKAGLSDPDKMDLF